MEIYLIRHTQPKIPEGVCYGRADLTLEESFEEELEKLNPKIPATFDRLISSPAKRCKTLAQKISPGRYEADERLWEMDFGEWELKRWSDIPRQQSDPWIKDFVHQRPPLGENFLEVQQRVIHFWEELLSSTASPTMPKAKKERLSGRSNQSLPEELKIQKLEKVGVVFHGGPIRALLAHLLEIPLKNAFRIQIDYGSVCLLELKDSFVKLKGLNT
ncbi:alpha-ribazole phosphatase family protein [Xanthovirga aplysinae]|uniref:alpha-ribazole phosphatase family protein n=1 Tax=Xanthovirga aplysinae TaxID=2529853 RepID=UPI0016574F5E|nr:alpha-ribazole phosphatase family protein [Xanthovirga aplysinae]